MTEKLENRARPLHPMRHLPMLLLLIMARDLCAGPIVCGYYPSWGRQSFPVENIAFENLTHLMHAFAWPDGDGDLKYDTDFLYPKLVEETHQAGRKILVSLGGAGRSGSFSPMAKDAGTRHAFVVNLTLFCVQNNYDGADVDWEIPENTQDRNNLNLLIQELRTEFNKVNRPLLITMAVPAGSWAGQWIDYETLKETVDWFGCMTYDFFGSWIPRSGHNAPLYPPAQNNNGSVQSSLTYLNTTRKVPKDQILIGIPFYGRGCDATGYNRPNTGGDSDFRYSEIVPLIGNGWDFFWDEVARVPYLLNEARTKFITYDDTASVRLKCEFASQNGTAGVMIWALGQDGTGTDQPLLETVGRTMHVEAGMSDPERIRSFEIVRNYPNPFNNRTRISFYLHTSESVSLDVLDMTGKKVSRLSATAMPAGWNSLDFDGSLLPSGTYIYRLEAPGFVRSGKMALIR
ncbi:T9SS type A sorting domain-containing protein [bacterium]|nr:T9SS type A sorting domain-containing protein [bacterium]